MNIFENQVIPIYQLIPIGIHNISKSFRPNLATIRVLSLGMKFIPKTQSLMWKRNFSNFEDFRRRMNNKMFFFVEELLSVIKLFGSKIHGTAWRNTETSTNFVLTYETGSTKYSKKQWERKDRKKMPNKEKPALKSLQRNKNIAVVINDTDKNVGPVCADKKRCH